MTKRTPNHIRELNGNPGKRPIKSSIQPIGDAQKPDHLAGYASDVWDRLISAMPNIYKSSDSEILAAYCLAAAAHREATINLAVEGRITSRGRPSPWVAAQRDASKTLASLGSKLGLDPVSREAVAAQPAAEPASKFAGLINMENENDQ